MRKIACSLFLLAVSNQLQAAEGFWLSNQLVNDPDVRQALALDATQDANPLPVAKISQAVARIGECSGAFISSTGLFITSAHCVKAYLPKSDQLIATARLRDEIPLPGLQLDILQRRDDVTITINRQLSSSVSVNDRAAKLEQIKTEMIRQCQSSADNHCEVSVLHYGLEFYLERYYRFRDVRLVYLPQQPASAQGHTWPRYEADYVILRAYAGVNNTPSDYALTNQPYQSQNLRLSTKGVEENELLILPGFSSQSRRFASAAEVQFHFEQLYPLSLLYVQQGMQLLEQRLSPGSELADRYQATLDAFARQANSLSALLQHYQQSTLLSAKQRQQEAMVAWINTSPVRQQLYGPVLAQFDVVMQKQQAMLRRDLVLSYLRYAQLPNLALKLYQHAVEPNGALKDELTMLMQRVELHYDTRLDMEMALHYLGQYAQLPPALRLDALDQYFALSDGFNRDIVKHKLAAMYRGTALSQADTRQRLLSQSVAAFEQSDDPLISFAVAMQPTVQQLAAERKRFATELSAARAAMMEVVIAFNDAQGISTYAESNGQLRFSIGQVSGYQPTDAVWYQPFSSLRGLQKQQLSGAGIMLPAVGAPVANIPVNFISSADSCSGYGFAPTFNRQSELVGILYSGIKENMLADWYYDVDESRAVHVDSRFIIWQLQQDPAGQRLLQELKLR